MIKTPEQYLGVLTTGNLEPLYEHDNSSRMLIKAENEELMEGKPQIAVLTDDDAIHVLEHSCILNSPEARRSPQILQNTLDHIQQHIDNAKSKDPALTAMLKQASFAQAPPMSQGGGSQGEGLPAIMDNSNPITQQAEQTALPEPAQPPMV